MRLDSVNFWAVVAVIVIAFLLILEAAGEINLF